MKGSKKNISRFGIKVRKKFLYKLMLGMILFCIVPIIAGNILFSYYFSDKIIAKYEIEDSDNLNGIMLNNTRILNELTSLAYLAADGDLRYFAANAFHENISGYDKLIDTLQLMLNNGKYLDSIFLYSDKFKYIHAVTMDGEGFSRDLDSISLVNLDQKYIHSWMPRFEEKYFFAPFHTDIYLEEGSSEVDGSISYIIPVRNRKDMSALVFNIKFSDIRENSRHILNDSNKNIYLQIGGEIIPVIENFPLDKDHYARLDHGDTIVRVNGRKMIINRSYDEEMKLTYFSIIPEKDLIRDFNAILATYYVIIIIFMLLFILFAYIYSKFLYRPMEDLLETISSELDNDVDISKMSEFQVVLKEHHQLIQARDSMREELKANKILLRRQFLGALIRGRLLGDIKESINKYEIELSGRYFSILLIYLEQSIDTTESSIAVDQWEHWQNYHETAEKSLRTILGDSGAQGYLCRIDRNQYGIILDQNRESIDDKAADLIERLIRESELNLHISVSNSVDDLSRLNEAYNQAVQALHLGVLSNKTRVHYYSEIESVTPGSHDQRPYKSHIKEFNKIIRDGGEKELADYVSLLVDHAQESYTDHMQIMSYYIEQVTEIISYVRTMTSIDCRSDLGAFCSRLYECRVEKEVRELLYEMLRDLMERWQSLKKTITAVDKNVESAMTYMEKNYHKPISLEIVSDSIGLNPSYLSRIFKKSINRSFYHSLASIRMEKARELLKDTDLTIAAIAEEVGFGTAVSFSRTFKKFYNCNPKEFREAQ